MLQPWGGGWSLELRYRAWSKSLKLLSTTWIRASYEISEYTGFIQAGCWEPNWWHPWSWESLLGRQWWLDHFEHQRYGAVFWCICEKCQGHKQIMIHTSDTDILVLAVSYVTELFLESLWLAFGSGKNFRYISVHEIAAHLGPRKSVNLRMFHAFTGCVCDTVSSFEGKGRRQLGKYGMLSQVSQMFSAP